MGIAWFEVFLDTFKNDTHHFSELKSCSVTLTHHKSIAVGPWYAQAEGKTSLGKEPVTNFCYRQGMGCHRLENLTEYLSRKVEKFVNAKLLTQMLLICVISCLTKRKQIYL